MYDFDDDIQRSFSSDYFAGHGIKAHAISLLYGMICSRYLGSWRVTNSGLLNLNVLNNCLTNLFHEEGVLVDGEIPSLPVVYGYVFFPVLSTIVP